MKRKSERGEIHIQVTQNYEKKTLLTCHNSPLALWVHLWVESSSTHTLGVIIPICSVWFDTVRWSSALFKSMSEWHLHLKQLCLSALVYVLPGYQVIHEDSSQAVSAALYKCASPAKCCYKHKHI